jgi:hypothetical protein
MMGYSEDKYDLEEQEYLDSLSDEEPKTKIKPFNPNKQYLGKYGFKCERKKYERLITFRKRCKEEEINFLASQIELIRTKFEQMMQKEIIVPKDFNFVIYCFDSFFQVPIIDYKIIPESIKKDGFKSIYKKVKVRFELE